MPLPDRTARRAAAFEEVCTQLEAALAGPTRRTIVETLAGQPTFEASLLRLRDAFRTHAFKALAPGIALRAAVGTLDSATQQEGFHVLHDWDGKADQVNPDIIPVDVLHYLIARRGGEPPDAAALAILLDYYFVHLLQLLTVRIWDHGDADDKLDRVSRLLALLQSSDGSGHRFAIDAEMLLLIATSHFELEERGYVTLLERTRTLNLAHRTTVAVQHASSMGSHLRFGFEATYRRDTVTMRDDNVADYPWLCFALATLMDAYERQGTGVAVAHSRETLVESLLNGLSADARAFIGRFPPRSLSDAERERARFAEQFAAHKDDLCQAFAPFRPVETVYSPLAFFFNFSHNVVKGAAIDALLWGQPWRVTLDDLLSSLPRDGELSAAKERLSRTLMGYARANPDRISGRPMPVIVYDPAAGRQAFATTLKRIEE